MSLTNYTENAIMNWFRGTAMPTAPATVWVALFNGDPGEAGSGGTEVTTTIRVAGRVAVPFAAISGGAIANSGIVDFGSAAGAATVNNFGLFDAATAGNLLCKGALTTARSVAIGNSVTFATGALSLTID